MNESSFQQGSRVAVRFGIHKADDGSTVDVGEVGWIIGFSGLHWAVVSFDTPDGDFKSAEIPLRELKVVERRQRSMP